MIHLISFINQNSQINIILELFLTKKKTSYICSPLQLLTSGGGSKAWAGKFKATSDKLEFLYDGQGFMSMQLSKTDAQFAFYDVTGTVLHSWGINKTASADGH